MKNLLLLLMMLSIIACSNQKDVEEQNNAEAEQLETKTGTVEVLPFGTLADGTEIEQYVLTNANGIIVKVITYGGIIQELHIPDKSGKLEDVVLGYDNIEGYVASNPYFGAIIGRYGNRIAKGRFELDGTTYELAQNDGENHLHGGVQGFDKVVWDAEAIQKQNEVGIKMSYTSADMEEGYPGSLKVEVTYLLNDDDELIFDYKASTDKKTIVNLTNHAYYNLAGNKGDILNHELLINAEQYLPVSATLIPTELTSVKGTPFDFTKYKKIGQDIGGDHEQLKNGLGYDHCWVLPETGEEMTFAASLVDPESGRKMDIYTEEPGIQFYSGNFLDGSITGKEGTVYAYRSGLCLETQHFPDAPNRPDFPSVVLNPGDTYTTKTVTKFTTQSN